MKNYLKIWLNRMSKIRSRQGLYEFLVSEYSTIPANSLVLSVGAGGEVNGLLVQYAKKTGFEYLSFDINPNRQPDLVGDICTYEFGNQNFDVVVLSEVLEHLHDPRLGLNNIYKILKPNGKLILSTPFILPIHDRPYDYFRFTRYGLALLLSQFKEVIIKERNTYFEAIDVLWLRLLQTQLRSAWILSIFIIPIVFFLKRPISLLLGKVVPTDSMTTGYVVTAVK